MKKKLPIFFLLVLASNCLIAQVTRLSNNTNLSFGVPVTATKAIFIQQINGQDDSYLWTTDGTTPNTQKLNIPVTLAETSSFVVFNNKMYFSGLNAANGAELWVTDGTAAGTSLIKDINAGTASSSPTEMIVLNNTIFFFAKTAQEGIELWKSDGTPGGTNLLKDINTGIPDSYSADISYSVLNNQLYFSAVQANGLELWKTDGTTGGTVLVADINQGAGSSSPEFMQLYNGELFFTADDGIHGKELWKTNGTLNGTTIVKDIAPGAAGSQITNIIILNNKMLFAAVATGLDMELFASDGTMNGTNMLKDIYVGPLGSDPAIAEGIFINNKIIFAATSLATGRELFVTDGTQNGTGLFKDIKAGTESSNPEIWLDRNFIAAVNDPNLNRNRILYNGKIFFSTSGPGAPFSSNELWITDGTAINTVLVKDLGLGGLFFNSYFYTQSGLYFAANDPDKGYEVFKSQGTTPTTLLYADVNVGMESSLPFFQFFTLNGKVFFIADDGDSPAGDFDLFIISANETPLPVQLLQFAATVVSNGVNLGWTTAGQGNTAAFELQRSKDGSSFAPVGTIEAGAPGGNKTNYQYLDDAAYQQNSPTLYYRLKIIEHNGKFSYSPVAIVQLNLAVIKGLQAAPNPAAKFIRLNFTSTAEQHAQILITNNNGQVMKTLSTHLLAGNNQQIIGLENLAPGFYVATLIIAGKTEHVRFVKE